jgi:hypothetical protein
MKTCPRCGKTVEKLIELDNALISAQVTQIIGVPYSTSDLYCITCAREVLGISDEDLIREERNLAMNPDFYIRLLGGRIGQAILECIFRNFGYEVYPYGYESYLTNIIKHMRKGWPNTTVSQIRATPDMLIYDRELNEGFLVEVKTTTLHPKQYWIESKQMKGYKKLWSGAILIVIHTPSLTFYCKAVDRLDLAELTETAPHFAQDKPGYNIDLEAHFDSFSTVFRLIDPQGLAEYIERIKLEVIVRYNGSNPPPKMT